MSRDAPVMLGVDWGTSHMRLYLVGDAGQILESRQAARGILTCTPEMFPQVFLEETVEWRSRYPALPVWMTGMVGSRKGWRDVPYVPCPATPVAIAKGCVSVAIEGVEQAWITPGLQGASSADLPDVMRGEETQLVGLLSALPASASPRCVCLPGTHAKWVRLEGDTIQHFDTAMTGELFGLLTQRGLLAQWMAEVAQEDDDEAFARGVTNAQKTGGLLHHLFSVRSLSLVEQLPVQHQKAYLSGLLIGHELLQASSREDAIYLVGADGLCERYLAACRVLSLEAMVVDGEEAVVRGLLHLSRLVTRDIASP